MIKNKKNKGGIIMSRKFNLKELVNQAKNRTRKLSHEEWDLISENWRSLGEGFLVRFLPYLRWDLIIDDMETEKDFNIVYGALFGLKNPSKKCILKDGWKQGYPRKDWSWDFIPWRDPGETEWVEEPTPEDLYHDALEEVQLWYVKKELPVYIVDRIKSIIKNKRNYDAPVGSYRFAFYGRREIIKEMVLSGNIDPNEEII